MVQAKSNLKYFQNDKHAKKKMIRKIVYDADESKYDL